MVHERFMMKKVVLGSFKRLRIVDLILDIMDIV